MTSKPLSLVVNPAAFIDRPGALARQKFARSRLVAEQPLWCTLRKAMVHADYKCMPIATRQTTFLLKRDSAVEQKTKLHLPFVREMMEVAGRPLDARHLRLLRAPSDSNRHWRGFLNNDTIVGPRFFAPFQTLDKSINCIFVRVWDVLQERPDMQEAHKQAAARSNYNSLEGLFIRDEAIDIFEQTYPDVILGWAWDETTVLWATHNDEIKIHAIDDPRAALHVLHSSSSAKGPRALNRMPQSDVATYNSERMHHFFLSL